MLNISPVLRLCGIFLVGFAMTMIVPALVSWLADDGDMHIFIGSGGITLLIGLILLLSNHHYGLNTSSLKQSFLMPLAITLMAAFFGSLPIFFSNYDISFTDAILEAVSGITATNNTSLNGILDRLSSGLLLWRSLLQWIGGGMMLALVTIILPNLQIGGMEIFGLEQISDHERGFLKISRPLKQILWLYCGMTLMLALALWLAGMTLFDAINHGLTTLSCGGFSTHRNSIGFYHSPLIDWIILLGMFLGGIPFLVHWQLFTKNWQKAFSSSQLRWYLSIIIMSGLALAIWLITRQHVKALPALRHGFFAATSVLTGTGFATRDWSSWIGFTPVLFLLLMITGGCAGSTAGGLKIFRLQILVSNGIVELKRLLHPNSVIPYDYAGQKISADTAESVLGYLFIFICSFAVLSAALAMAGLDFNSAISASASAISNLGPGLTPEVGVTQGIAELSDTAKWMICIGMLFGRTELFIILVFCSSRFWK